MKGLVDLANKLKVGVLEEYTNNKQCKEFIHRIANCIRESIVAGISRSEFFSILLDGSTGRSETEEIIIYVRYININDGSLKESFLAIAPLENSTASGYLESIDKQLNKLPLDWRNEKCRVGLETDGAPSMIGAVNGLATKMKECVGHITTIHCAAHKLQLSVLKSLKGTKYNEEIDHCLIAILKFYNNSSKKQKQLAETANVLSTKLLKLQKLHTVRWVASKLGTIKAVITDWLPLVTHLENVSCYKNGDGNKAKGILKTLKKYCFVRTLHFLYDFLSLLKKLSLVFQKTDLLLNQVHIQVSKTLANLNELKDNPGTLEEQFLKSIKKGLFHEVQLIKIEKGLEKFTAHRKKIIDDGIEGIELRFMNVATDDKLMAVSLFDTFTWPKTSLEGFGNKEITAIASHYMDLLQDGSKDEMTITKQVLDEWYEFKVCAQDLCLKDLLAKAAENSLCFTYIHSQL